MQTLFVQFRLPPEIIENIYGITIQDPATIEKLFTKRPISRVKRYSQRYLARNSSPIINSELEIVTHPPIKEGQKTTIHCFLHIIHIDKRITLRISENNFDETHRLRKCHHKTDKYLYVFTFSYTDEKNTIGQQP